ncbi:hypothetical protein WMY93_024302 [Mugilogobius chulae]|uniref:Uncharacterized protein n=1 Tax=Mugilogobius chulae TaxID=88201 RepID=A0AAW0N9B3_9GOBI
MALWGVLSLSLHCWVCLGFVDSLSSSSSSSSSSGSSSTGSSSIGSSGSSSSSSSTGSIDGPLLEQAGGPLDWLLSDKGPFHHSPEYIDFVDKNRQGFSTRYKIYRLWTRARAMGWAPFLAHLSGQTRFGLRRRAAPYTCAPPMIDSRARTQRKTTQ